MTFSHQQRIHISGDMLISHFLCEYLPPSRTDEGPVTYGPLEMDEIFSTVFQSKQSDQDLNFYQLAFQNLLTLFLNHLRSKLSKKLNCHNNSDSHNIFLIVYE